MEVKSSYNNNDKRKISLRIIPETSITDDFYASLTNSTKRESFSWDSGNYSRFSESIKSGMSDDEPLEWPSKICVIGDVGVGKTSCVQKYVDSRYKMQYKWTVGVDFALKVVKWSDTVSIKLQLWDIAGQERFTSMTRVYYKDSHACIIMFDLTQRSTFVNALRWKNDLDSKCTLPDGSPVPCILLANKCDLPHREVEQNEIEQFCKEHDFIGWTETSVKEGLMIEDSMKFLLDHMMMKYGELDDSLTNSDKFEDRGTIRLRRQNQNQKSESKCGC